MIQSDEYRDYFEFMADKFFDYNEDDLNLYLFKNSVGAL